MLAAVTQDASGYEGLRNYVAGGGRPTDVPAFDADARQPGDLAHGCFVKRHGSPVGGKGGSGTGPRERKQAEPGHAGNGRGRMYHRAAPMNKMSARRRGRQAAGPDGAA